MSQYQQFQPPPPSAPVEPPPLETPPPQPRAIRVTDALSFVLSGEHRWHNLFFAFLALWLTQGIPFLGMTVFLGWLAEVHRRLVLRAPDPYMKLDVADVVPHFKYGIAPTILFHIIGVPAFFLAASGFIGFIAYDAFIAPQLVRAFEPWVIVTVVSIAALVVIAVQLFAMVVGNAALTRAELTGNIGEAFSFEPVWRYTRATWKTALIRHIQLYLVAFVVMLPLLFCCVFTGFLVTAAVMIAQTHLRWQIYNDYLLKGGEPIPLAPRWAFPSEMRRG